MQRVNIFKDFDHVIWIGRKGHINVQSNPDDITEYHNSSVTKLRVTGIYT